MQKRLARIAATAPFNCGILLLSEDQNDIQWADLAQPGFHITRASNLHEAKRLFAGRPEISVVVVDLENAGADGSRLAEALRSECPGRDWVEYVVLSGPNAPGIAHPLDAQAFEVLSKPLGPGDLLAAVTESYNASRLRRLNHEGRHWLETAIAEFQMRVGAAASHLLADIKQDYSATIPPLPGNEKDAAKKLRALINEERMRARLRERVFGSLARNRANWMLLLVLSEAFQMGQEITIKSTAYHAGLPLSSALRTLNELCSGGLAVKREDPKDARRSFISLTSLGQSYFVHYGAELSRAEETAKTS